MPVRLVMDDINQRGLLVPARVAFLVAGLSLTAVLIAVALAAGIQ